MHTNESSLQTEEYTRCPTQLDLTVPLKRLAIDENVIRES